MKVKKYLVYLLVLITIISSSMTAFFAREFKYGSQDDAWHLYLDQPDDYVYDQIQSNGFSNEVVVKFLEHGKCLGYLEELKAQGRVPQDYVPSSSSGGNSGGSSSTPVPEPETEKSTEKAYTQEEIDNAWKETKRTDATCTEEGSIQYKNKLTGKKKTETIPMIEHVFEEVSTTDSTCTTVGYTYFACSGCGLEGEPLEIPLKEHDFKAVEEDAVMPTCTEEGKLPYVCEDCGETTSKPLSANGHDDGEWAVSKPAKAFTEGERILVCTDCKEVLSREVIPQTSPLSLGVCVGIGVALLAVTGGIVVLKKKKASNQ